MQLVDNIGQKTKNSTKAVPKVDRTGTASQPRCVDVAISLMNNVLETACERAPDLDLMRLLNFMDLYRVYLQLANDPQSEMQAYIAGISGPSEAVVTQKLGDTALVSFERFVRDSRLLSMAATAASLESGETIATPLPLTISANS